MTQQDFFKAAFDGDLAAVRSYIEDGGDVNTVNKRGMSALMIAVWTNNNPDLIAYLLEQNIDLGIREPASGWRALTYAGVNGNTDVLRRLFDHGDTLDEPAGDWKTFMFAVQYRNAATAQILLDHGADVNGRDEYGKTALMRAASNSDTAMIAMLLDRGADVNIADNTGTTALMYAAHKAKAENIRLLLAHGADSSKRNNAGATASDIAEEIGKKPVITALREAAAV